MNEQKIKQILEDNLKIQNKEIEKHKIIYEGNHSIGQREKLSSHYDRKRLLLSIINDLGFEVCECCGRIK